MNETIRARSLKAPSLAVMGLLVATWSHPSLADTTVFSTVGDLVGSPPGSFAMDTYNFTVSSLAPSYSATLTDTGLFGADPIGMSLLSPSMKLLGTQVGSGSFNFVTDELGSYTLVVAGKPTAPANFDIYGVHVSAVPEVNSWLMMLAGLGMVGFRLHRRRDEFGPAQSPSDQ